MKKIYIKGIRGAVCLCALVLTALFLTACQDEVALPQPVIKIDTESILAPSLASAFKVEVESNCDWIADVDGDAAGWLTLADAKNIGYGELSLQLKGNDTSAQRSAVIRIHNESNTVVVSLTVSQNPSSGDGLVSIRELRSLASASNVTLDKNAMVRGVIVTNLQHKNFPEKLIAIEDGVEENCGIVVKTSGDLLFSSGEEVEISLGNAKVERDGETGLVTLIPSNDGDVVRTEASAIVVTPADVTVEQLADGGYESMYVKVSGQIATPDINKEFLYEASQFVDSDNRTVNLSVLQGCSFAEAQIPSGSGYVCGVVGMVDGATCIYPCTSEDFSLSGARFDGGFYLPYVISLMTNTATNFDGRYIEIDRTSADVNEYFGRMLDGSGATVRWNLSTKTQYYRYWTDTSGHHNMQLGSWMDMRDNYLLFIYPSGVSFTDGFRLQFGWGGLANAPRNWEVLYSTDNISWSSGRQPTKFSIPQGLIAGSGKGFFDVTVDVYIDSPISADQQLYVKIVPAGDNEAVNSGAAITAAGRAVFHSCMVLDRLPSGSKSAVPSGALYYEPFDALTEGADYRLGDKLSAMLNYGGPDIEDWDEDVRGGLTGKNVRQRPGYAQIGYVNSIDKAHGAYVNEPGELITPAFNESGTLRLTFKAMAYRNKAVFSTAVKDRKGDMTQGVIEVIGGGTINGQTSVSFGSMSYDSFKSFTYTIEDATPETRLKFTSAPGSGDYSRWFIDNICIKK